MGTATTKDVSSIKKRVNQLIEAQSTQQEAIVYIVSILNVTRYTAQVNRQHINIIMVNLNMVNISSLDFHIWQHVKDHRNETQLHHLSSIPSVQIAQLYNI